MQRAWRHAASSALGVVAVVLVLFCVAPTHALDVPDSSSRTAPAAIALVDEHPATPHSSPCELPASVPCVRCAGEHIDDADGVPVLFVSSADDRARLALDHAHQGWHVDMPPDGLVSLVSLCVSRT